MPARGLSHKTQTTKHKMMRPSDELILVGFVRYYYLTSRQVCRLFYSPTSLTYVQTKLKTLADRGLLQRLFLPRTSQYGSAPSVYTLARKGLNFLKAQGFDVSLRYHPSEEREHSYLFLSHTLAVNDVFISAELFSRRFEVIRLNDILHERALKRTPVKVEVDGEKQTVIPDGWLDLRLNGSEQMCFVLELDQGTVEQKKWRKKVKNLLAYSKGPYQEAFKTTSLTVAIVATPGEKRLFDLLRWTEEELEDRGQDEADLFRFAGLSPAETSPEELFLSPIWYRPFDRTSLPLLYGIH